MRVIEIIAACADAQARQDRDGDENPDKTYIHEFEASAWQLVVLRLLGYRIVCAARFIARKHGNAIQSA